MIVSLSHKRLRDLEQVSGVIFDFDGVFTDNSVYVDQEGRESVRCSRLDGIGLAGLRSLGLPMVVISSEKNPVVASRCSKLSIECHYGVTDKVAVAFAWAKKQSMSLEAVAFVGNDVNDIPLLKAVGFSVVVQDCVSACLPYADFMICKKGGNGAVRVFCDYITDRND